MLLIPAGVAQPAALLISASPPTGWPNCVNNASARCASTSLTRGGNGAGSGFSSTMIGNSCVGAAADIFCFKSGAMLSPTFALAMLAAYGAPGLHAGTSKLNASSTLSATLPHLGTATLGIFKPPDGPLPSIGCVLP